MADKPMYYGTKGSTPMYYGGRKPMYYGAGGRNYGKAAYGSRYGAYGSYGAYGAYGGEQVVGDDESALCGIVLDRRRKQFRGARGAARRGL